MAEDKPANGKCYICGAKEADHHSGKDHAFNTYNPNADVYTRIEVILLKISAQLQLLVRR